MQDCDKLFSLPKSTLLILFEEDGAPNNIKLSCGSCYTRLYPAQARPCCPTSLILSLLGFHSSLLSVVSHVLSSPRQTSNILHPGSSRCSSFPTMSFRAASLVAYAFQHPLSRRMRQPWMTCSSFTPLVLHANNKPC
jgi:hypothetical protein